MNFDNATSAACNDNSETFVPRASKVIEIRDIPAKGYVRAGKHYDRSPAVGQNATIVPGKSITLHGEMHDRYVINVATGKHEATTVRYSTSFVVGGWAVYGSYNLIYTGRITSITAKTVTIIEDHSNRVHRLDLHEFNGHNWDYSAEKVFERNSNWSD